MLRGDSKLADATGMQTALKHTCHRAGCDVDVVSISAFPDAPDRRTSATLVVTDCESHDELSFSTTHAVTVEIVLLSFPHRALNIFRITCFNRPRGTAGRPGAAERFVVPLKPGNTGGGKGPQFKTNATRGEGPGDWGTYQLRRVFRNCGRRCTRKRRQKPASVSMPCTTRSSVRTSWPMPTPSAAPTRAHRVCMVRSSRTSRRMGC